MITWTWFGWWRSWISKGWRLLLAIARQEPRDHISDLWGEFSGKLILCGKPPNQYLLIKR